MTKKSLDTLAVLEAQLDSAKERIKDPYHAYNVEWLHGQIEKLEAHIKRIRG